MLDGVYECPKNMAFIMLAHFDEYRCNKCDFIFISPDINMGISFLFSLILFYLYRVDAVRANCVSNIPWICTWLARRRSPWRIRVRVYGSRIRDMIRDMISVSINYNIFLICFIGWTWSELIFRWLFRRFCLLSRIVSSSLPFSRT